MKKNLKSVILVLCLALLFLASILLVGCAGVQEDATLEPSTPSRETEMPDEAPNREEIGMGEESVVREKLIKKGELYLHANDVTDVSRKTEEITSDFNGFIEESSFQETNGRQYARFTLRVPAAKFDDYLAEIASLAHKTRRHTFTEDVTEEFIDLEARLQVLQAQEKRLMEMLDEVVELEDVLKLETELTRLREPIESIQGRLDYLERLVAYSTLHLTIEQARTATQPPQNVFQEFWFNIQDGWRLFISAITSVMGAILYLWPFVLIVVALIYWRWRKKIKKTPA